MRTRYARRAYVGLEDRVRLAIFIACAAAGCVVLVFAWFPRFVDAGSRWLASAQIRAYEARLSSIEQAAAADPASARMSLLAASRELGGVRKLDRLLPVARQVELRALSLCEELDDRPGAVAHARRLVELDDRDLFAIAELGRVLGADPSTRPKAIGVLHGAWERVPDSPLLVRPLCELLIESGEAEAAARVIAVAGSRPRSDVWHVDWGSDPRESSWIQPCSIGDGRIEARFTIEEPIRGMRLRLPELASFELRGCTLEFESEAGLVRRALRELRPRFVELKEAGDAIVAHGAAEAAIVISAAALAGAVPESGPCTVTLWARVRATEPQWLRSLRTRVVR